MNILYESHDVKSSIAMFDSRIPYTINTPLSS